MALKIAVKLTLIVLIILWCNYFTKYKGFDVYIIFSGGFCGAIVEGSAIFVNEQKQNYIINLFNQTWS